LGVTVDRFLHAANALINLAALVTAGGPLAAAGAGVTVLLSGSALWSTPAAPDLAKTLAADMQTRLTAPGVTDDQRALIPQMIEAGLPEPAAIIGAGLVTAPLIARMEARLTYPEHLLPANLTLFRAILTPVLDRLLNDPEFITHLAPAFMRAVLDRLTGIAETLIELSAHYGSVARSLDNLEDLRSAELEALAFRFNLTPAPNTPPRELLGLLQLRAQDVADLERELETLRARFPQLDNQISVARGRLDAGDTAGVREMVRNARQVLHDARLREALQQDAELVELDARALLIENRVDEAFAALSVTADSFAAIDPLEPARRRILRYVTLLHDHGLRYGGPGISRGLDLLAPVLTDDLRQADAWLWAAGVNARGIGLSDIGERTVGAEGAALLAEAVTACRAALEVYTRADHPANSAATQNNLGIALWTQGERTGGPKGAALMAKAVTAFRAALEVRTRADHPVDWAKTQNNLGNALRAQGSRTGGAECAVLLAEAVTAYCAALEVQTRADHPAEWAGTQNNLGNALSDQGERTVGADGAVLLSGAVTAYCAALEVRTRAENPVEWAKMLYNLAMVEETRAEHDSCTDPAPHLRAALDHVTAALEVFDPAHMPYDHGTATALRDQLQARLAGMG